MTIIYLSIKMKILLFSILLWNFLLKRRNWWWCWCRNESKLLEKEGHIVEFCDHDYNVNVTKMFKQFMKNIFKLLVLILMELFLVLQKKIIIVIMDLMITMIILKEHFFQERLGKRRYYTNTWSVDWASI